MKPRILNYGLSLLTAGAALLSVTSSVQAADKKPNILIIWGDDIGLWNVSAYNQGAMGYKTPNIDRIAKEGALFTDWYAQQSCTAGRGCFITGQSGFRTGSLKVGLPGAKEGLQARDVTIAQLLKAQGYMTAQFGKNHLGQLLAKLKELGIEDNTIVMYSTDNGAEKFSWPDGGTSPYRNEKTSNWEGGYRVPCAIRWPGVIKPGTVSNDIYAHEDMLPTIMAAAGVPDVKEQLLKGMKVGDKTFKVHLDGYDLTDALAGKSASPRHEFFYFNDDGSLVALRYDQWKLVFAEQRAHGDEVWQEPFVSLLKGDLKTASAGGDHALIELLMATHTGMTTLEFEQIVKDWIATAKHPRTGRLYTEMVYQPMLEVLASLRANGFKNYIVSGGGIEFMRAWAEPVYGIPPEQVIGSSVKTKFEMRDRQPVIVRLPELNFLDGKEGKPVGINQHIGRRPIAAFGNSRGDQEMLEYTQGGRGARFELLVLHDDAARESAYGPAQGLPDTKLGAFTQAVYDQAQKAGWTVASMKDDWKQVFSPEKK